MQNVKDISLRIAHSSVFLSNIPTPPPRLNFHPLLSTWTVNLTAYLASDSVVVLLHKFLARVLNYGFVRARVNAIVFQAS